MYIKTKCSTCGEEVLHNIRLERETTYDGNSITSEFVAVKITDTCTIPDLAQSVLHELAGHIYNGITKAELCKILHEQFGIFDQYCCDIVQQLKVELDMYSPDHKHLYFVNA